MIARSLRLLHRVVLRAGRGRGGDPDRLDRDRLSPPEGAAARTRSRPASPGAPARSAADIDEPIDHSHRTPARAPALAGGAAADRLRGAGRAVPGCGCGGDPSKIPSALIGRPAPQTALPALRGPRPRRRAGARARSGGVQGQGQRRQCLGVVVRALPRRGAAADRSWPRTSGCRSSASTTRMRPTTRGASSAATAIRSASSASTATAAPRSNGASMACRRPSWSAATAPSPTSWSAR